VSVAYSGVYFWAQLPRNQHLNMPLFLRKAQKLLFIQGAISAAFVGQECFVRAEFHYDAFLQHHDVGGVADRAQAVRNNDAGALGDEFFNRKLDY
jgi:hypothetical protein